MTLTTATAIVALLLAISLAVERVVELLKKLATSIYNRYRIDHPAAAETGTDAEKAAKSAAKQAAANDGKDALWLLVGAVVGTIIASQAQAEIAAAVATSAEKVGTGAYVIIGLLSAGGSKFWNQILDILHAAKVQKESVARDMQNIQRTQPGTLAKTMAAASGR